MNRVTPTELARLLGPWRDSGDTLPDALAAALIDAALLPEAAVLPAQRTLARALGVARGTITTAYGRVVAVHGSGSKIQRRHHAGLAWQAVGLCHWATLDLRICPVGLSSGSLPGLSLVTVALTALRSAEVEPYLGTDGYFPAGPPPRRAAIAHRLTDDGMPTRSSRC